MKPELDAAKEWAVNAGAILLEHYSTAPSIQWKGINNPVTTADRAASSFIVEQIRRRFPDDGILSEEEPDESGRLTKQRVWIIDPMDGTKEFIAHRGEFAVMIGLAVDGKPSVGAVYQPTENKLYYASTGAGAFLESSKGIQLLKVTRDTDFSRLVLAASRSHHSGRTEAVRQSLNIPTVIRSGGIGIKVGLICEGRAHLYLHAGRGTCQWDTCAPQVILDEAGGRMTDIFNRPLNYNIAALENLKGVVATNGVVHGEVIDAIARLSG